MSLRGREGPTAERQSGAPWVRLGKRNLSARRDEPRKGEAQVSGPTSLLPVQTSLLSLLGGETDKVLSILNTS